MVSLFVYCHVLWTIIHHRKTEGSMVSHEIYRIRRCYRRDPIGCMGMSSLNRGSLLIKGHGVITYRELIHVSFPPSACFYPFVLFCLIVASTNKEVEVWDDLFLSNNTSCPMCVCSSFLLSSLPFCSETGTLHLTCTLQETSSCLFRGGRDVFSASVEGKESAD
jgi:hypothetical protein